MDKKNTLNPKTTTDESEQETLTLQSTPIPDLNDEKRRAEGKIKAGTDNNQEEVLLLHMQASRNPKEGIDDSYDPHLHRVVEHPTNNFETLVHLVKCSLGTGILAMPQAFGRAGLITGIVGTLVIGSIITYCLHVLVRSQYALCKRKQVALLTYPESMVVALEIGPKKLKRFAKFSPCLVNFFLIVYQLGICCIYTLFIASTLKKIADPYFDLSVIIWMLIILVPLIIANLIRDLKMLAPFSSVANVLILLGLAIIVYYIFSTKQKSDAPYDLWGTIYAFPLFFGTVLFALTAVGVVIALENNMKYPKDFGKPLGVLNVGMIFIVILYVAIGFIGYSFCKEQCADSISLDMEEGWESLSVQVMYAIAILISYVLQCYVPVEILWKTYLKPRLERKGYSKLLPWEYGLRIVLCILTFAVALVVPRLGLFISLFGALCLSALGLIFPAFMEICTVMPSPPKVLLIKNIVLIIIGFFGMIVGTYTSIAAIILSFTDPHIDDEDV